MAATKGPPARKLTAEELATADLDQPAAATTGPAPAGPATLATLPGRTFTVGDTVITDAGVWFDADTAQAVRTAAAQSGVPLREL